MEELRLASINPKSPPLTHKTTCVAFTAKSGSLNLYGGDVRKVEVESNGKIIDFGIMKVASIKSLFDDVVEIIMEGE